MISLDNEIQQITNVYKKGYFGSYMTPISATEFDSTIPNMLNDFRIICDSAKKIGVKIYNTSDVSPLKNIIDNKYEL